jgi:hypothetical protein
MSASNPAHLLVHRFDARRQVGRSFVPLRPLRRNRIPPVPDLRERAGKLRVAGLVRVKSPPDRLRALLPSSTG